MARLTPLVKVIITLVLVTVTVAYFDFEKLPTILSRIQLPIFVLVLLLNAAGSIVLPALVTQHVLAVSRVSLSLSELVRINFAIRFYTQVLPFAASAGLRWWRYRTHGNGDDALALLGFERLAQLLIVTGTAAVLLAGEQSKLGAAGAYLWMGSGVCFLLSGLAFLSFVWPWLAQQWMRVTGSVGALLPAFIRNRLLQLAQSVAAFQNLSAAHVIYVVFVSMLGYLLVMVSLFLLTRATGIGLSFVAIAWIRSWVFLLTFIPITIGGIGVRDISFAALMHLYGVPDYQALAFSLLVLFIQLLLGFVGAMLELWRYVLAPPPPPVIQYTHKL